MNNKLNKIFEESKRIAIDDKTKIVIMSDYHRGAGDNYDNFVKNQAIYEAALINYYNNGFTYIELGDGDEMWEVDNYNDIVEVHLDVFKQLKRFYDSDRLFMIYGNHDIVKRSKDILEKYFYKYYNNEEKQVEGLLDGLVVYESLVLDYEGYDIFLIHGHQVDFLNGTLWCHASVRRIITNEKYVGDLRSGKYYSDNVISHKRKVNYGEKEQYFTSNHHEAIISLELWNKCQEILEKRSKIVKPDGNRDKFSRKYPFSSKIYCVICGERFIRRSYKIRSNNKEVAYWICRSHRNKIECPNLLHYKQEELEDIFVKVYNKLFENKDKYINTFIKKVNEVINENNNFNSDKIKEDIVNLQNRLSNLIDLKLDNKISQEILNNKEIEITNKIKELENKLADNKDLELSRKEKLEQINNITKILKQYKGLTKFNEDIFNNLVDRIIIGEKLDNGKEDLYKIKFIFKTGEMIKDNLPNNKLKIGSDMGHYGFSINKQSLEIKEDNVSAYVLRKNTRI